MDTRFTVVTPEGAVTEQPAESVTLPTLDGEITVLANHIPLVSVLVPGVVTVRHGENEEHLAVSGGFVQVSAGEVRLLADTAERAESVDTSRAQEARQRAEEAMAGRLEREEVAEAAASLQRNLARLRAAELAGTRRRGTRRG